MNKKKILSIISLLIILTILVSAGCAPSAKTEETQTEQAAIVTEEVVDVISPTEEEVVEEVVEPNQEEETPAATPIMATPIPTLTEEDIAASIIEALPEERSLNLEWPEKMWLKEADVIILSLIPSGDEFVFEAEFANHTAQSEPIEIPQPEGYILQARAWLDAPGFTMAADAEQTFQVHEGQPVIWRWSLVPENDGQQRINITAQILLEPPAGVEGSVIEHTLLSESLEITVKSILGLPRRTARVLIVILVALLISLGVLLILLNLISKPKSPLRVLIPDRAVTIEALANRPLDSATERIMQALFRGYSRIIITSEFQSGYSGARTWLVMPIHADGRHDAQTIVKVGAASIILAEYQNYENFVKDTLPPMTARIQGKPARVKGETLAALRYTFIGLSGQTPLSLREALLANPNPNYLQQLFETFGPNWWCQRSPATFRLAEVYDSILPSHLVMTPANGRGRLVDGHNPQDLQKIRTNDLITLKHFPQREKRADGKSYSLESQSKPGQPPVRVRWMSPSLQEPLTGKIITTRWKILRTPVDNKERFGLPDPLDDLETLLETTLHGSQAIIHGDLNLENVLVGPGDMVWLIDFARTRKGPPLVDFTHLYGEIIAQVIAPNEPEPAQFLEKLKNNQYPLLKKVDEIAHQLLPAPNQSAAYDLPLIVTCLGMMKFPNLTDHARHLLYLTAAWKNTQHNH